MPSVNVSVNWISHRGFKEHAPENTRAAFDAAVALGFRTLETDLRLTVDGHIVLHHDPDLRRLLGDPRPIGAMRRVDLEQLSLAGDHRLLFLDEFAERFADLDWVFDIKPETGVAVIQRLGQLSTMSSALRRLPHQTRFVLWRAAHEAQLRALWPTVDVFARESQCWRAGLAAMAGMPFLGGIESGRTYALPSCLGPVQLHTRARIDMFHQRGARVLAFLPATNAEVDAALAAGVDDVLTNGRIAP